MLYRLIAYTSINKLRVYLRVICAPIRSWGDISAQHFPSLPPGELCFWRPQLSSRRSEILYRLINMYQLKILSCTSHLVTMFAMPPVDYYITTCIFYWKTVTGPRYYNGRGISRPNVEMNCNDIFMRHFREHVECFAQSPVITAHQLEEMADC